MILSDPTATEWGVWDYRLAKAHFLKKSFMSNGYPPWIDQSPRVIFETRSYISKSEAAIERANKGDMVPGKRVYAVPKVADGGSMPTMAEYIAEQERLRNLPQQQGSMSGALGPVLTMED